MIGYFGFAETTNELVVKVCRDALRTFGQEHEELVLIEELSELITASNKLLNLNKPYGEHCADYTNFVEEIGDVLICMEYLNIGRELDDVTAIQFNKLREDPNPYESGNVINDLLSDLIQACSELIQAVVKINRYTSPDRFNEVVKRAAVLYRIVDILFNDALFGGDVKELVETSINNKTERLRQRIKHHLEIKGMLWDEAFLRVPVPVLRDPKDFLPEILGKPIEEYAHVFQLLSTAREEMKDYVNKHEDEITRINYSKNEVFCSNGDIHVFMNESQYSRWNKGREYILNGKRYRSGMKLER